MKIAFFSCHDYEKPFLEAANERGLHELTYLAEALSPETARLAAGHEAVCVFVNDSLARPTLEQLAQLGIRLVALRCTGYNHVDVLAAKELGLRVVRVPSYSPHAIAEHAVALLLALNRKTHLAYQRTKENNFTLDGLLGFDLYGKRVGVVGTGRIGGAFARIMLGFGCHVMAYDKQRSAVLQQSGVEYLPLPDLLKRADVVSLHCPLTPETYHLIGADALAQIKPGAILINTGRGGLVDSKAAIDALADGRLSALGMDVYELEENVFFHDWSSRILPDPLLDRLTDLPNVLVTSHQGFFTREAMEQIARTTLNNLAYVERQQLPADCVVVG